VRRGLTRSRPEITQLTGSPADEHGVETLQPGNILVDPEGRIRIVRTRTSDGDGWNCTDGAPILDSEANDRAQWAAYTPERLASALRVAAQVEALSDEPMMSGGIRTWDACSGRPCVLPKLAGVVRANRNDAVRS